MRKWIVGYCGCFVAFSLLVCMANNDESNMGGASSAARLYCVKEAFQL